MQDRRRTIFGRKTTKNAAIQSLLSIINIIKKINEPYLYLCFGRSRSRSTIWFSTEEESSKRARREIGLEESARPAQVVENALRGQIAAPNRAFHRRRPARIGPIAREK